MDPTEQFGQLVRRQRRSLDLTQERLARLVGCATVTIKKLEAGEYRPSRQILSLLAQHLQIPEGVHEAFIRQGRLPASPAAVANPYVGLEAFRESDAPFFFGREALVARLVHRLAEADERRRFLAVIGPSGSGKSSLVHAGLVPSLRGGALGTGMRWLVITLVPGPHPKAALGAALRAAAPAAGPADSLDQLVQAALAAEKADRLLVVVDQFEELFTLTVDPQERTDMLSDLLAATAGPLGPLWVVVALRADFLDRPLSHPAFGELVRSRAEMVLPLAPDALERAIVAPAARCGVQVEPGLTATLIHEVGDQPGRLPLLQFTLTELFANRSGVLLSLADYQQIGGLAGTLARSADAMFDLLDPPGQEAARRLFLQLVTPGEGQDDTRRRVYQSDLAERFDPALDQVFELFGQRRLLTFDRDVHSGASTVEIAHEALIHGWPRLSGWVDAARDDLRVHRHLSQAAAIWHRHNQEGAYLATGAWLTRYEAIQSAGSMTTSPDEQLFVLASLRQRDQQAADEQARQERELKLARSTATAQRRAAQRLRLLVLVLAVSLLVATALSGFAVAQYNVAQENVRNSEALRLAAEASTLAQQGEAAELVALLSIRSLEIQETPQGQAALDAAASLPLPEWILSGHDNLIQALAVSADGSTAITASLDYDVRRWDLRTNEQRGVVRLDMAPSAIIALDQGAAFLVGLIDGTVELWRWGEQAPIWRVEAHEGGVTDMAVMDGGAMLVTAGTDSMAHVWRVDDQERLVSIDHGSPINAVAIAGELGFVTAGENGVVQLWSWSGAAVSRYNGHRGPVQAVAVSTDGRRLLTGGADSTARVWQIEEGRELRQLRGHVGAVTAVAFLGATGQIATAGDDRVALIWPEKEGAPSARLTGSTVPVIALSALPDDSGMITTSGSTVRLWRFRSMRLYPPLAGLEGAVARVAVTPDGRIGARGGEDGSVWLWEIATGEPLRSLDGHRSGITHLAFSPDGATVASTDSANQLYVWHVATGAVRWRAQLHDRVNVLLVSPDGTHLLTAAADGSLNVWNVNDGQVEQRLNEALTVDAAGFTSDGGLITVDAQDLLVTFLDGQSFRTVRQIQLDAPTVLTRAEDTGLLAASFFPTRVTFVEPGSQQVMLGSGNVKAFIWDALSGRVVQSIAGHSGMITTVALSATAAMTTTIAVTTSEDQTARVWDVATGRELRRFSGHVGAVTAVTLVPEHNAVVSASTDGTVRQWALNYRRTIQMLCERLQRDFAPEERARYNLASTTATCAPSALAP